MKLTKKLLSTAILVLTLCIFVPITLYASEIRVNINHVPVEFADQGPVIVDGRTLVPVRDIFEALGFEVDWHYTTQTITLTNVPYEVILIIGSPTFTTNGEEFLLDVPAQIINGKTMLPIRALLESLGMSVWWNPNSVEVLTLSFFAARDLLGVWNALRFTEYVAEELVRGIEFNSGFYGDMAVQLEFLADGTAIFSETGRPDVTARWSMEDRLYRLSFSDIDDGTNDVVFSFSIYGGRLILFHREIVHGWEVTSIEWSFEHADAN